MGGHEVGQLGDERAALVDQQSGQIVGSDDRGECDADEEVVLEAGPGRHRLDPTAELLRPRLGDPVDLLGGDEVLSDDVVGDQAVAFEALQGCVDLPFVDRGSCSEELVQRGAQFVSVARLLRQESEEQVLEQKAAPLAGWRADGVYLSGRYLPDRQE